MQIIILAIISLFLSSPSQAATKKVQRVVNKGITDITDINIRKRTKKLVIKNNSINTIENYTFPDNLKVIQLIENSTQAINGLTFGENLKKIFFIDDSIEVFKNITFNNNISELLLSSESLADPFELDISSTNIEILDINDGSFTNINGLILNDKVTGLSIFSTAVSSIEGLVIPQSIRRLTLSSNNLTHFNGANLNNNLETLELGNNMFSSYSDIVNIPQKIKYFQAGGRQDPVDFSTLNIPDSVETFSIGVTLKVTEEDLMTVNFPPNLKKLLLRVNNITSMDELELPSTLELLDLRGNIISKEERKKIRARFKTEIPGLKIKFGNF